MLSVKQRGIKYHFLNLWYDSTWDWTPVVRTIGEHSKTIMIISYNNVAFLKIFNSNIEHSVRINKMEEVKVCKYVCLCQVAQSATGTM